MPFKQYLAELRHNLASGLATEPTYYPALKRLLEDLDSKIDVFTDPKHIDVGHPDFTVRRKGYALDFPVGWVEAKDIGEDLNKIEKTDQLKRYLGLPNLILTDFLEFRWYTDGKHRLTARLATLGRGKKLKPDPDGEARVQELLLSFVKHKIEPVRTPKELALRMARLAHLSRNVILRAFETESQDGKLHHQFQAFRDTLIPDLKPDQFADMYAQTIAYGLFAARCQPAPANEKFTREKAAYLIPKTNPFLRKLFNEIAGPELDPRIAGFVDDLVALLRDTDIDSVLAGFGRRTGREDPVVHFYEDFLQAYNPKERKIRGIYYTPEPVVSYIVRSIDHLLKTRFDKPLGLADPSVLILDPACGTGTFLYFVIRQIYETLREEGQLGAWNNYVSRNLLPRIFGFELLMAPYAVAHLKLGLQLKDLGYQFDTDERLGIYLTNTLEEAMKKSELLIGQWIADEANAASEIKRDKLIMVVLGNPPYSISSLNRGPWISKLLKDYKFGLKEKKLNIDDDYIKFIRFAQWRIEQTGYGILAYISNNSYLDGLVHRRMRESLRATFPVINILNLHGSAVREEIAPAGGKDQNVFDIQQGVTIALYTAPIERHGNSVVSYADLWGTRHTKSQMLFQTDLQSTKWSLLQPSPPYFFFVPKDFTVAEEHERAWHVRDVFRVFQNGLKTDRDDLFFDFDRKELAERMRVFFSADYDADFEKRYRLYPSSSYDIEARRGQATFDVQNIRTCHYRPFDLRLLYYDPDLTSRPAFKVMKHMLPGNRALVLCRQVTKGKFSHCLITKWLTEISSLPNGPYNLFPLYLYGTPKSRGKQREIDDRGNRSPNFKDKFLRSLSINLGLSLGPHDNGDLKDTFGPSDVLCYVYAVFHCPSYRQRYAEFLKIDFPRVPLTSDKKLFAALVEKGAELVSLHLLESPRLNKFITKFPVSDSNLVEKVRYEENHQRVYINKNQCFEGVPKQVWEFHIGGYQVCQKWLKDRKGRTLSWDDIQHYQKIVVAIKETLRLMAEIDTLIPSWPLP